MKTIYLNIHITHMWDTDSVGLLEYGRLLYKESSTQTLNTQKGSVLLVTEVQAVIATWGKIKPYLALHVWHEETVVLSNGRLWKQF